MNTQVLPLRPSSLRQIVGRCTEAMKEAAYRLKMVKRPTSQTVRYAQRELAAVGYTPLDQPQENGPNKWIQECVLELLDVFSQQGHSGSSAPYCVEMFRKLALCEPLGPLSGEAAEWNEVGDGVWQNNRCSHVFKGADGRAYDINGRIFVEPNGCSYTNQDSHVYVTFPYTPTRECVAVMANEST